MSDNQTDIIDLLSDIKSGSALDHLRARRPVTKEQAQASWDALFDPLSESEFSRLERFAVALFVAELHGDETSCKLYQAKLKNQPEGEHLAEIITKIAQQNKAEGPYGRYQQGPLSVENKDGPFFILPEEYGHFLSPRLSAALAHAHFLVLHPRDASTARLKSLTDAGWSETGIITLSQLISFLAFQLRVISGLKILADA